MEEPGQPAYARVADVLRHEITSGVWPVGGKLPSIAQLEARFGVSEQPVRAALRLLLGEGLVEGRAGSGTFVRDRGAVLRFARTRRPGQGGPLSSADVPEGARVAWSHSTERAFATAALAGRLGIDLGDPVQQTRYRCTVDGAPVQLVNSWEPLAVVGGTGVLLPEDGPLCGAGVPARMAAIGFTVTRLVEEVGARPASKAEVEGLRRAAGLVVLVVERSHWAGARVVETADIVIPGDGHRLVYELPVQ
ncbi:GntR family transcriptional regulator [Streptodolium elevatio]